MNFIDCVFFIFLDSVPKASSPLLTSPPTMTPGIAPPMSLPLPNVSPTTTLPTVSPPLIPSAPSPVSLVNPSAVQGTSLTNTTAIVGQTVPPLKPVLPAAPSRKSKITNKLFIVLIVYLFIYFSSWNSS